MLFFATAAVAAIVLVIASGVSASATGTRLGSMSERWLAEYRASHGAQ